ncbi:MAG TPA: hypothetical protein DCE24_00465 [Porphyromonadaceae bacterium]|nr:hypothetical protein [Porphyromonadaceae bacterium]
MLILIAESKTMRCDAHPVAPADYSAHTPQFEAQADATARELRQMSRSDLATTLRLGPKSAETAFRCYYDFPDKSTGLRAIEAFTGVVFRHFAYPSLTGAARTAVNSRIAIISSIYGLLRPSDIVKPYRLDFNSPVMGAGLTPMRFWRELTTDALLEKLSSTASDTILNLLPKDAAACIDMKRLSASATIITPDFKIQKSGGLATPQAGLLKAWRGQLLREIIKGDISSPAALKEIETGSFVYSPEGSSPTNFLFIGA